MRQKFISNNKLQNKMKKINEINCSNLLLYVRNSFIDTSKNLIENSLKTLRETKCPNSTKNNFSVIKSFNQTTRYNHYKEYDKSTHTLKPNFRITNSPCINRPINSLSNLICNKSSYVSLLKLNKSLTKGKNITNLVNHGHISKKHKKNDCELKNEIRLKNKKDKRDHNQYMLSLNITLRKQRENYFNKQFDYDQNNLFYRKINKK